MATDPRALNPGLVVIHMTGQAHTIRDRKDDDSGWWLTDGSGPWDGAWISGAFKVADEKALRQFWETLDA